MPMFKRMALVAHGAATNVMQIANMSAVQWYEYWPTATIWGIGTAATVGAFTNITAVGVWHSCIRNSNGAKDAYMDVQTFRVQGYAVGPVTNYIANQAVPATINVEDLDVTYITNVVYGNGILNKTGTGILYVDAGMTPGNSPGSNILQRTGGTLIIGESGARAQLSIEVASRGDVAGTNYDLVAVQNLGSALNLAAINLVVTNSQLGMQTNWFLTSDSGINGSFNNVQVAMGSMNGYGVVYQANRVGIWFVPEPAMMALAGLAVLFFRKM